MPAKQQDKQSFLSTVSLLHASTGMLEISALPSQVSPDWLLPTSLIIDSVPSTDGQHNTVTWQEQSIPVYSLLADGTKPETILIVEGSSDDQRVAIAIAGEPSTHKVRISELKDVDKRLEQPYCMQAVMLNEALCAIPDMDALAEQLNPA